MTNMQQTQLEASHNLITEGIIDKIDQGTNTELEEDTTFFPEKIPKIIETATTNFITATHIPPTMTNMQQTQLEASHNLITEGIIDKIDQGTNTELEEDTTFFPEKIPKIIKTATTNFITATPKRTKPCDHSKTLSKIETSGANHDFAWTILVQHPK